MCSSNKQQNIIVDELIESIDVLKDQDSTKKEELKKTIKNTRLGGLIEFSRAVHAEMDAIITAGRNGVSTQGTKLFVTTFPCHYCARHIITAGITEVQYIEPYPKSLALQLHEDAITTDTKGNDNKKVLFHPFVGVAPHMYARAFEKKWKLKNDQTGKYDLSKPEWSEEWRNKNKSYLDLEDILTKED